MRKSRYQTTDDEAWAIFDQSPFATIACTKENNEPYAVNVSMARIDRDLYFHCALEGEKIEAFKANPHVCVSAVGSYHIVPEKFTVFYESVILEGMIEEIVDRDEKIKGLEAVCHRFSPEYMDEFMDAVEKSIHVTGIFKIHVNSITGKRKQENS